MRIVPYLTFDGQCRAAMTYYAEVLGGDPQFMTFGEAPEQCDDTVGMADRIMHAELTVAGQTIMGCDAPPRWLRKPQGFSVTLDAPGADEAERLYAALSEGGDISMPMAETFWALRFGAFTDRFGTPWMINCSRPR